MTCGTCIGLASSNFVPVTGLGASPTAYEVTQLNGEIQARVTQLTFRVSW